MKYSDFHLYTVAKGQRFVEAAERCKRSFEIKCPGIGFTIFKGPFPKYFKPDILKKKPYADLLLFKYADAPFMLKTDAKYIGQVDADCLCMCKLPFEYFIDDLNAGKFCAASDPKCEVNRKEIDRVNSWALYFNSGVCFWRKEDTDYFFSEFGDWVRSPNINWLSNIPYQDQTWMNIFFNLYRKEYISEIGWYWNFRGCVRHPRAYIWHAGGRDSEGIEVLKKEFESWK